MQLAAGWLLAIPETLRAALGAADATATLQLFAWNVRWLVNIGIAAQQAKKAKIFEALELGQVVCLQETHWLDHDAALWRREIPLAYIIASNAVKRSARHGPAVAEGCPPADAAAPHRLSRSDRCGGVAILLPPGCKLKQTWEPVPGYCIACEFVDDMGTTHRVACCYLESGCLAHTWDLQKKMPHGKLRPLAQ